MAQVSELVFSGVERMDRKLEVLISCMDQTDDRLIQSSQITGHALMIDQCDQEGGWTRPTLHGTARCIRTTQRGLTRSRNMAIAHAIGDVCLLCDDDEVFLPDYEETILGAYRQLPQADVIIFKMADRPASFPDKIQRLRFPKTAKVSSWQISFRRESLLRTGVRFDELLGAGTGNGAEEELKFLLDCQRAGLQIYYFPGTIARVAQTQSTWFRGYDRHFFYDRGATTRYILGWPLAAAYALYYVLAKRALYRNCLTPGQALGAIFQGMAENKIGKQAAGRERTI